MKKNSKKIIFFPLPPAPSPGYPQDPDPDPHEDFCPDPDKNLSLFRLMAHHQNGVEDEPRWSSETNSTFTISSMQVPDRFKF